VGERDQRVNGLFDALGKKIADQWLTKLLLPGLLWVCVAALAWQLRWTHALDMKAAEPLLRPLGSDHAVGQSVAVFGGVLIAAAGAGMTAAGLATVIRGIRPAAARSTLARYLRAIRLERWERVRRSAEQLKKDLVGTADSATVGPELAAAKARQDAISLEAPKHATWVGDRLRATVIRIHRAYGLDVNHAWPLLRFVLSDSVRADITAAQGSYANAEVLGGWAVLYAAVGLVWGPALVIAAVVLTVSCVQARSATEELCQLVEAAVDLYGPMLAEQLRIPCEGALTPEVGAKIDEVLRKDPWT
jgi:hypothetical protein